MKYLKSSWLTVLILLTSCGSTGIKFDPDAYVGRDGYIINKDQVKIYTDQPLFKEYACMHLSKWKELSEALDRATVPKRIPKRYSSTFKRVKSDAICSVQEVIQQIKTNK